MTKRLTITNGLIPAEFLPDRQEDDHSKNGLDGFHRGHIQLTDGLISAVSTEPPTDDHLFDATNAIVLPGFVDLHVHGGGGYDTMDATTDSLAKLAQFKASHGTTAFLPTTITAPHVDIVNAIAAVADYIKNEERYADFADSQDSENLRSSAKSAYNMGARILGVHVEGPYISPTFPGAQPVESIREPNLAELAELLAAGPVSMLTLAPEIPKAHPFIQALRKQNITAVLGHTNATYDECEAAIQIGVSQATHTYNAMRGLHHREPGALGAVLTNDAVYAQLIADNIHVHPASMNLLARCKGIERTVLITDAMRAAGLPEGTYHLGHHSVTVEDGACRLADGTLAGSLLTMEQALINFMQATGYSLAQAWPATSRVPAQSIGMADKIGSIQPGHWADLVVLDSQLQVVATVVGGEIVYQRNS